MTIWPGNGGSISQESGEIWTAQRLLQPISFKSDRLLGQPHSEIAGRNASEPMSSLVNLLEKPTLYSGGEGRWMCARAMDMAHIDSRGDRGGMLRKTGSPVLETRQGGGEPPTTAYKETKTQQAVTGVGGVHSTA